MKPQDRVEHFQWIDALRGLAALVIVIGHYHHFYLADALDRPNIPDTWTFPYASLIGFAFLPLATHAVQLFWVISGFVFAHVYLNARVSLWEFGVARFARLYPLHALTLIVVAILQVISLHLAGHWQIYENNDLRHFGLQLLMASNWSTLARGLSFNGPIWSVSLEILVYAMFFMSLAMLRRAPVVVSLLLTLGCWSISESNVHFPLVSLGVFACGGYFFLGCAVYGLCFRTKPAFLKIVLGFAGFVGIAALGLWTGNELATVAGFSGALLLAASSFDLFASKLGRRVRGLGNISYSLYLVHVPLQILVLLIADVAFDGDRRFADSHLVLPLYLATSVLLAWLAYYRFELPARTFLRRMLLGKDGALQARLSGIFRLGRRVQETG